MVSSCHTGYKPRFLGRYKDAKMDDSPFDLNPGLVFPTGVPRNADKPSSIVFSLRHVSVVFRPCAPAQIFNSIVRSNAVNVVHIRVLQRILDERHGHETMYQANLRASGMTVEVDEPITLRVRQWPQNPSTSRALPTHHSSHSTYRRDLIRRKFLYCTPLFHWIMAYLIPFRRPSIHFVAVGR
jgi:hypothetical protein